MTRAITKFAITRFRHESQLVAASLPIVTAGAALIVCMTLALRDPRESSYGICPWLAVTGTHCPGCGSLRSINRLMNFDIWGAINFNVLTIFALPLVFYGWLRWALPDRITKSWFHLTRIPASALYVLAGVLVAYSIVRNLPWYPFSWFAPHDLGS